MLASRRQFLSKLAITGAALRTISANPLNKPIGLQLYMVEAELAQDFDGTLAKLAQIGIKEVEIAATYNKTPAAWKAALTRHGLHCRSVHVYDTTQPPEQIMTFARDLGAKYVVTSLNAPPNIIAKIPGGKADWVPLVNAVDTMNLDDWKHSASIANQLGDQAANYGLTYAYHNHNIEFKKFGNTTAFETLLALTDPAKVYFEMDCGWVSAAGYNPATFLEKYPSRIRMLHIKAFQPAPPNTHLVGPEEPKPAELGHGNPDYKPILDAAAIAQV